MTSAAHTLTGQSLEPFTDREAIVWLTFHRDAAHAIRVRLPRDRDEARRIVEAVGPYNNFDPAEAWRIVDGWFSYVTCVELERNAGVVLTFTLCRNAREYELADMTQLVGELVDAGAPTVDHSLDTRTVRAWWD